MATPVNNYRTIEDPNSNNTIQHPYTSSRIQAFKALKNISCFGRVYLITSIALIVTGAVLTGMSTQTTYKMDNLEITEVDIFNPIYCGIGWFTFSPGFAMLFRLIKHHQILFKDSEEHTSLI